MCAFSVAASAATLRDETLAAWAAYLKGAAARPWAGESPERARRIRGGDIVAVPVGPHSPVKVAGGLIHDWMGAVFLPDASLDDVLAVVQDYARYKEFYKPLVVDSRTLEAAGPEFRFSLLTVYNSLFAKRALAIESKSSYRRIDERHASSVARSTRIEEIEEYGSAAQRTLPENEGSGYLWRLYSVSRFERRSGGVIEEMEVIALSRDVPAALCWLVDPIIRRVSRDSLTTSLSETRTAVQKTLKKNAVRGL
jgi:hypothetical protein